MGCDGIVTAIFSFARATKRRKVTASDEDDDDEKFDDEYDNDMDEGQEEESESGESADESDEERGGWRRMRRGERYLCLCFSSLCVASGNHRRGVSERQKRTVYIGEISKFKAHIIYNAIKGGRKQKTENRKPARAQCAIATPLSHPTQHQVAPDSTMCTSKTTPLSPSAARR